MLHSGCTPSVPGWCSPSPGSGSAGCTQTLFLEKMISPSRPERADEPPAPGLKVRRSEALEEARRRSRPRDISTGRRTLGPSSRDGERGGRDRGREIYRNGMDGGVKKTRGENRGMRR